MKKGKRMKFVPKYDPAFMPFAVELEKFRKEVSKTAHKKLKICVERNKGNNYILAEDIFSDTEKNERNYAIIERLVKAALWVAGGYKIYVFGDEYIYNRLSIDYTLTGARKFDVDFMSGVYEKDFEVVSVTEKDFPDYSPCLVKIGGHLDGCRIGFDAGGSDRKVSAVIDGKVVYSEEVVWNPKLSKDYHYQYDGIKSALLTAASKMPRVDAVGVSSAGVYIDNKIMVSSLFINIPQKDYKPHVQTMYLDIAKELGYPIEVANDGDVTALAGAMELHATNVLGIALGTSEAGGYINSTGTLNGWISELAFVPVDLAPTAMADEWSGDIGCGVKYFSQDAVIKLAQNAGIKFDEILTPAEKLKTIQSLLEKGDEVAKEIFADIGIYLGYTIAFYSEFYDIDYLLLLGRVTSGVAGTIIADNAKLVLDSGFPKLSSVKIVLPDESNKRVGQSIAAASLTSVCQQ